MQQETFKAMLTRICGEPVADDTFKLGKNSKAAVILSVGSTMATVDQVREVQLAEGYVVITTRKDERNFVSLGSVVGLRVGKPEPEGAGFLNR